MVVQLAVIFLLSLIYGLVRYVVFGSVNIQNTPAYVVNKALAAASAICLLVAAVKYFGRFPNAVPRWCFSSLGFALPHVFLSLALWSREYYPKLYGPEKMNASGEWTLLFGVLNICFFGAILWLKQLKLYSIQWLGSLLLALHTAAVGWMNWLDVESWPSRIPPISLLSSAVALAATFLFLPKRPGRRDGRFVAQKE